MRIIKILTIVLLIAFGYNANAQEVPTNITAALKADDATELAKLVTKDNINNCYQIGDWQYSLLAQTIRSKAKKCFDYLIAQGADVNKACDGYVPPLFHAAKYGSLEMLKILVSKGAKVDYVYAGDYSPADGKTPVTYAEDNNQKEIAKYLRSVKK
ncbi:ankyrin repeat domain-containing protein [Mucilaginibacter ximonensis]|uniref:Ankyrin repeat domain-containing protein n=1 Tax=Mucilaginibacter ximonensis TaxID=538021 RepID=A0ABW5YAB8_9SPHI